MAIGKTFQKMARLEVLPQSLPLLQALLRVVHRQPMLVATRQKLTIPLPALLRLGPRLGQLLRHKQALHRQPLALRPLPRVQTARHRPYFSDRPLYWGRFF